MHIVITSRNMDLTDPLKDYAEKKLSSLEKYFSPIQEIDITLQYENSKEEGKRQVANVTVFANGTVLRGSKASENMYASIDLVADKMEKQILKIKNKVKKNPRGGTKLTDSRAFFSVLGYEDSIAKTEEKKNNRAAKEGDNFKIIRDRQPFAIKPMFVEEAADQMVAMGQEFLVFSNAESSKINILYRRADGNMGLIEPEN